MAETVCSNCQGTGWVLVDREGRSLARRCDCFVKNRGQALLAQANLPRRYRDCTFDNYKPQNKTQENALKLARKFVDKFPVLDVGLLFQGSCGVGKTHLAVSIINELVRNKNAACYFCDFRELIRSIQNSYSADSPLSETDLIAPIFERNMLVLDELGAKRTSPWVEETVFYIINHRYNNKKMTIFTSNYLDAGEEEEDKRDPYFRKKDFDFKAEETLVDRIGIRLRSRIYEMCKVVNIEGDDFRKTIKQAGYRF